MRTTLVKRWNLRTAWAACAIFFAVALAGCENRQGGSKDFNVKIGDPVPAFSLKDIDGNIVSSKDLLGKPYVVAVYATWCPPCKMELAALEKAVWQPLKEQGIGVVGINYGDEDANLIRGFAEEIGVTFPMLVDQEGSFRAEAGVSMVPQSLVVGKDGKILDLHVGFTDESIAATEEALNAAL